MLKTRFYSTLVLMALAILVITGPKFITIVVAGAFCVGSLYELHNLVRPFNPKIFYPYALLIVTSFIVGIWIKWQLWPGEMWLRIFSRV